MPTQCSIAAFARLRKVSRQNVQPVRDLSGAEANVILDAGLALMPVQHLAPENWSPSLPQVISGARVQI
jgi:hypothetical protein